MWHMHQEYYWWGMHWFWWILWLVLLIWIFALPFDIPGQRKKPETPLDILKKRYASGEIDTEEYEKRKRVLQDEG